MSQTDFNDYPLHDAVLVSADVNWAARRLILQLHVFYEPTHEAMPATLTFSGVAELSTAMRRPWGDSAATTILDQRRGADGAYMLQLNTGDELRVTADAAVLERV